MKTVFDNRMVAHVWAQQNQSEGRSNNGQLYFRDKTIFSYRDSWPLATFIGENEVLLNTERISVTTSKHFSYVRNALKSNVKIWPIDRNIIQNPEAFLKMTPKKREKFLADKYQAEEKRTKEQKAADAKRKRERIKKEKAELPRIIGRWLNNEELSWSEEELIKRHHKGSDMLRLKDAETVETSRGATMPVKFAGKIWDQVKHCIATKTRWEKNGHRLPAGHFEIDAISSNGDIEAGCHSFLFGTVEILAAKLNLK